MVFTRIIVNPDHMGGVPCIRGLRIPVFTVVGMVADGMSVEGIIDAYPDLTHEDVCEALRYAAEVLPEKQVRKVRCKPKFDWAGTATDLRDQYDSVELQHEISSWRADTK